MVRFRGVFCTVFCLRLRTFRWLLLSTILSLGSAAVGQTNCTVVESYNNVVFGPQGSAPYAPTAGGAPGPYLLPVGVHTGCPAPTVKIVQPSGAPNLISLVSPQLIPTNGGFDNYWFQLIVQPNPCPTDQIGSITFTSGSGSWVTTSGATENLNVKACLAPCAVSTELLDRDGQPPHRARDRNQYRGLQLGGRYWYVQRVSQLTGPPSCCCGFLLTIQTKKCPFVTATIPGSGGFSPQGRSKC